jgi:hypothetical protein
MITIFCNFQLLAAGKDIMNEEFKESSPLVSAKSLVEIERDLEKQTDEDSVNPYKKYNKCMDDKKHSDAALLCTNIGSVCVGGLLTSFFWYGYISMYLTCKLNGN